VRKPKKKNRMGDAYEPPMEEWAERDIMEIELLKRYVRLSKRYGFKALFRRKFWRVYMGYKETDKLLQEKQK